MWCRCGSRCPAARPTLWESRLRPWPPDRVRLLFAPWAALDAAKGDIYRVRADGNGQLWAQDKLEASGFCAIRLVLADGSPIAFTADAMIDKFSTVGVTGSGMIGLAVLDVPPDADLVAVRRILHDGHRQGWWEYEELSTTDAWRTTAS
jgi:hypothetical protein